MTSVEKAAFKRCCDAAVVAMEEFKALMLQAAESKDPMVFDKRLNARYGAMSAELDKVMAGLGYEDEPMSLDELLDTHIPASEEGFIDM